MIDTARRTASLTVLLVLAAGAGFLAGFASSGDASPSPEAEQIARLEQRVAQLEAGVSVSQRGLTLHSGSTSIALTAKGVVIDGRTVTINAGSRFDATAAEILLSAGSVSVRSSGDLRLKGSRILEN